MADIRYLAPRTLDEAIGAFAAAGSDARVLAGGTDLVVQMRSGSVRPGLIVDIKKIAEMTTIEEAADGGFRVGAAVPGAVLAEHPRFGKIWPGVLEAVNLIGSTQVQGRASAGGNLCNGSPAGDSVPALVAAGAIVTLQGPNGRREMPVEKVPASPGRTHLLPGEILVSFAFPPRPKGSSDAYLRMIPRTEMDIAVVGVGVSLTLKDGVCTAARVGADAILQREADADPDHGDIHFGTRDHAQIGIARAFRPRRKGKTDEDLTGQQMGAARTGRHFLHRHLAT